MIGNQVYETYLLKIILKMEVKEPSPKVATFEKVAAEEI